MPLYFIQLGANPFLVSVLAKACGQGTATDNYDEADQYVKREYRQGWGGLD